MRAHEFLYEHRLDEDVENFPIANVRKANGAIGNQGVNTEQAADVLTHAAGMQVSSDMSMRQLVDALKADPAAQQRLRQFVQQNPVTVYALPDGSYHLQDGHHRTFLLNLLGDETVPAEVKEDVTEAKTVEFEGLTLKVIKQGHELTVDALDDWGNKVLGHVKFNIGDGQELDPQDLHVDDKYQGQGIARVMYDYVKSLGYTINRSWDQTDAGRGFWNKHRGEDVRVWEAFDNPYKTKTEKSDYGDVDMLAKLPDGTNLSIMFNNQGDDEWQVEFYRNNSQAVTGEGDAQRVFATVLASMQKFIKKYKPWRLTFSASKEVDMDADDVEKFNPESRAKLYNRLVQRYAAAWGYEEYAEDHGDQITYELTRLKPGVAENFADGKNPEEFLGEYPSIETTLGEATHPDLVKYDKKQEKQLHRNLDISKGTGKDFSPDYDSDEKDWSDLDHAMDYTGGSRDTNDYLHRQYRKKSKAKELSQHQAKIQALDRLLANHQLPEQIVVYTGLKESPADAWKKYKADVSKPIRLHLPAYTSTTTKLKIALQHVADEVAQVSRKTHQPRNKDAPKEEWGSQILMITLPKGMPAASVKKVSEYPGENEILLPRGMDIEINPNPTVLKNGDCVWHTQVLGHNPVQIAAPMQENFADGRNPGRKGLAKRSGVNTKASVSSLRNTAKHSSGEKQRMAHWLANMKSGREKARRK